MSKQLPQISDAEWDVMKVLWDHSSPHSTTGLAASEVMDHLAAAGRVWAPQTVKTLLARLVAKHAAAYTARGKSYHYRAAVTRDEVTRAESESFLSRIFGSKTGVSLMLAHLVEQDGLSKEEIEACKALLDRAEKRP